MLGLSVDDGNLSLSKCQYWEDRRHASSIILGARGGTTAGAPVSTMGSMYEGRRP